ncbi:peptide chain release factor N(5)-glutamine methyltransferase [Candidatus Margulisiibacteriota bacterium]
MTWTISSLLSQPPLPRLEAELLLAHSLGLKRIDLYTKHERALTEEDLIKFKELVRRRRQHEPIAYITGTQPFVSLEFLVDQSVLIPRPETEELVEKTIDLAKDLEGPLAIADIGTGSGCIAVSLAKFLPQARVIGIDSSADAIEIAQKNAKHHQVEDRCSFFKGDLFEPLKEKMDIIVSNPPYIPTAEIETLEPDVKGWEPRGALDGGQDGLDYIRKLINEAPDHLSIDPYVGYLILEFGLEQSAEIKNLAKDKFGSLEIKKDQQGKDRFFIGS